MVNPRSTKSTARFRAFQHCPVESDANDTRGESARWATKGTELVESAREVRLLICNERCGVHRGPSFSERSNVMPLSPTFAFGYPPSPRLRRGLAEARMKC